MSTVIDGGRRELHAGECGIFINTTGRRSTYAPGSQVQWCETPLLEVPTPICRVALFSRDRVPGGGGSIFSSTLPPHPSPQSICVSELRVSHPPRCQGRVGEVPAVWPGSPLWSVLVLPLVPVRGIPPGRYWIVQSNFLPFPGTLSAPVITRCGMTAR